MQKTNDLPEGSTVLAEGGIKALGEMCAVLRSAGIHAALVRPAKDRGTS